MMYRSFTISWLLCTQMSLIKGRFYSCSLTVLLLRGHREVPEVHLSSISLSFIFEEDVLGLFSHEIPRFKTIIPPDRPSELGVLKLQTACVVNKKGLVLKSEMRTTSHWMPYYPHCHFGMLKLLSVTQSNLRNTLWAS